MKAIRTIQQVVDVSVIRIEIELGPGYEDMPTDFPLRDGDMWRADVEIDTGKILEWPQGKTGEFNIKVRDCGTYTLYDNRGSIIAKIENDYVPNGIVPGRYGDYVEMAIESDGLIANWPKEPDVSAFFKRDE